MHTLTHTTTGLLIGAIAFPNEPAFQALCVLASNLPDATLVSNWLRARKTDNTSHHNERSKEISHSIFVWGILCGASLIWIPICIPFAISGLVHVLFDVFSHGHGMNQAIRESDAGMLWPFRRRIGDLIGYVWEYRHRDGSIPWPPKPLELGIIVSTVVMFLITVFA